MRESESENQSTCTCNPSNCFWPCSCRQGNPKLRQKPNTGLFTLKFNTGANKVMFMVVAVHMVYVCRDGLYDLWSARRQFTARQPVMI